MTESRRCLRVVSSGPGVIPDPSSIKKGQVLVAVYSEVGGGTLDAEVFEAEWTSNYLEDLETEYCVWRGRHTSYDLNGLNPHWWMLIYDELGNVPIQHRLALLLDSEEVEKPLKGAEVPRDNPRTWHNAHMVILLDLAADRVRKIIEASKGGHTPDKWTSSELDKLYATALSEISSYTRKLAQKGEYLGENMRWLAKMLRLREK